MKLHREAFPTVFFASVIFILSNIAVWRLFDDYPWAHRLFFYLTLVVLGFVFCFFRAPVNVKKKDASLLTSPAYGKIVEIVDEFEGHFFKTPRKRVSIFMSPLNIHCNYVPMDGQVLAMDYYPGKYLVAYHPKASELNEHTFTIIKGEKITIGVKQIAGFMARRIVPYLSAGDIVEQNQELGFIKFGSRVDVFLPIETDLKVKVGDKVKGADTVLCELA